MGRPNADCVYRGLYDVKYNLGANKVSLDEETMIL